MKRQRREMMVPPAPAPPAMPPAAPPPPPVSQPAEPPAPQLPPVVQSAMAVAAAARQAAEQVAATAAARPSLPATPGYNTLGEPLRDVHMPYAPEGEDIVPIRLRVDGATLSPELESAQYTDHLLWNARDQSFTPEAFAKLTIEELSLPSSFADAIVQQIRRACGAHRTAAAEAARARAMAAADAAAAADDPHPAPVHAEQVVTIDLHVVHESGLELRDRLLWDLASEEPTPEAFARQLCTDLQMAELEGAVAFQVREALAAAAAVATASDGGLPEPSPISVRTEREALDWSPHVTLPGDAAVAESEAALKAEAREAERRDLMRRRAQDEA